MPPTLPLSEATHTAYTDLQFIRSEVCDFLHKNLQRSHVSFWLPGDECDELAKLLECERNCYAKWVTLMHRDLGGTGE